MSKSENEARSVTQLSKILQTPQPGVSKNVQKLLEKNYLKKIPSTKDARSQRLFLTNKGLLKFQEVVLQMQPQFQFIFLDLNAELFDSLSNGLELLCGRLNQVRNQESEEEKTYI